jgi:hypothetical protein
MPKSPERRIETRAKNKTTHPGKVVKSSQAPRRTKAEVQEDKAAKAQAKAAREEAKQQSINRAAEFETVDIANEDTLDATPRPIFTPKPQRLSTKPKNSPLTSFADSSDIIFDDDDETPFMPGSQGTVDAGTGDSDSAEESDAPPPPVKKKKSKSTQKATSAADTKKLEEKADRKRRVADVKSDIPTDPDEPQEPKPKKLKVKMREEINVAAAKILEKEKEGNKYANMVNSMGSSGKLASKLPSHSSQPQARPLKREGAVADIKQSMAVGGNK